MQRSTLKILVAGTVLAVATVALVHAQQAGVDTVLTNGKIITEIGRAHV